MDVEEQAPDIAASAETAETAEPAQPATAEHADMDVDSDDEVVQECDVYLNRMYDPPDFVGDMYLLQYPLRPSYRPYGDQGALDKVELKPKSRRLRFVYKLNRDHHFAEDDVMLEKHHQTHTLNSTVVANPSCSYAVGVFSRGQMVLTPIRAINQLRPDFEDFEKVRSRQGASSSSALPPELGGPADGSESAEEEAAAVSDPIGAEAIRTEYHPPPRHGRGDAQSQAKEAATDEPWQRLVFYGANSPESQDVFTRHFVRPAEAAMLAAETDDIKLRELDLQRDKTAFLAGMCGQADDQNRLRQERQRAALAADFSGLSQLVLNKMPFERAVEAVVRHESVASFDRDVRKRLRSRGKDEDLIRALRKCADLVAGCWVLKSENANFVGGEADARNMLLTLLNSKGGVLTGVELNKWASVFQKFSTPKARKEIVDGVLVEDKASRCFKIRKGPDKEFLHRFPDVANEYNQKWLDARQQITQKSVAAAPSQAQQVQQAAAQQAAAGNRAKVKLMTEVREALANGSMAFDELRRHLQRRIQERIIHEDELLQVLQMPELDAVKISGSWVLARTGNENTDKFRKVLLGLFSRRDQLTKQEVLEEYERTYGESCKLSDYSVRQQLREIADMMEDGQGMTYWVVKGALQTR